MPFLFTTCQAGTESVLKKEAERLFPGIRSAFARPGFVTFKTEVFPHRFASRSVFARSAASSIGKIEEDHPKKIADAAWNLAGQKKLYINRIHVFRRDSVPVGEQDFEPNIPEELVDLHRQIAEDSPNAKFLGTGALDLFQPARPGETVLDIVQIEQNLYMAGMHTISQDSAIHECYPGGIVPIHRPAGIVSRAFLKFSEGFLWSGFKLESGDLCLDIGSSPGGCSQFLLQQGSKVLGVDPGEMDPSVLANPKFTHIRSRIRGTKRSLFRGVRWITADMNVAPNYTLDVLKDIMQSRSENVEGLLFTLKLPHWDLAEKLHAMCEQLRSWRLGAVRMKHLTFNRQEIMVAVG